MSASPQPRALPNRILILGHGQVGVISAIALRMALPTTQVIVIPSPTDSAALADHIGTAMPFTNRLHHKLGISEMDLVQKAGASHRLATRYRGWAGADHDELFGYGNDNPVLVNAFTGKFKGIRNPGLDSDQHILNPAVALTMTGRFCPADDDPHSPLSAIDYALRWNVAAYRDLLISMAIQLGVNYLPHLPVDVQHAENGDIANVILNDSAGPVAADLYIDCSGPARWLISKMAGVTFESWSAHLPCDRVLIAAPTGPVLALEDRLTLTADGWLCEIGGRDGVHRLFAYPSAIGSTAAEAHLMAAGATDADSAAIHPGALTKAFIGNVIALGDAAASFEPMGGSTLDLAHRQLRLLLDLLPGRDIEPAEQNEYNRRTGLMATALRDWIASHYAAPGLAGTAFANHVAQLERAPSLALLLDQHLRHARVPFFEEAPMHASQWSSMLQALGLHAKPSVYAMAQSDDRTREQMYQAEMAVRAALEAAPPYLEWLTSVLQNQS
jgi:tryptophan halogenase